MGRPAWEDGQTPFPRSFASTWVESATRPEGFFATVPFEEAAARPILYYLLISIMVGIFNLWWTAIFTAINLPLLGTDPQIWGSLSPAANALFGFFLTPFIAVAGLILWSATIQALVTLFARERRGYRATMRVLCYASGPQILGIVPILGGLVGFVWSLVLTGIGLRHAHRMSVGGAIGVVALSVALPFVLLVAFLAFLFTSIGASAP